MIGSYVRKLREKKGYLLRQMAAVINVDPTVLSKMERKERQFSRETIIKIAEICNVNQDILLTQWLADKICDLVKEEDVAIKAIELALVQKRKNEK